AASSGSVATSVMLAGPTHPAPTRFPRLTPPTAPHEREDALVRRLLTGIAVFRWLAWAWMATLLVVNRHELSQPEARPWLALLLVGAALVVTVADTALLTADPTRLLTLPVVAAEV